MSQEIVKFIRKSNDLVEARYKFDIWETRLFTKMLTMIHREDEEFKEYKIYLKDIIKEFELSKNKEAYELLRSGGRKLMKKTFLIPYETKDGQKRLFETPVFTSLDSAVTDGIRGTGDDLYIEVTFHPKLKPYLLQLKSQFTMYDVRNILSLPSNYSIRIYELLKQYESIGRRKFEVQELKEILGVEHEYPLYANFKQRVIKKAQKDLDENTDIRFTFEELKRSRAVTDIIFSIQTNSLSRRKSLQLQKEEAIIEAIQVPVPALEIRPLSPEDMLFEEINRLVKPHVKELMIRQWIKDIPAEQIKRGVKYTLQQLKSGAKIDSVSGYMNKMVNQTSLFDAKVEERDRKEALKAKERDAAERKAELMTKFTELQTQRAARTQEIVLQLFAMDPIMKQQIIEETRIATPEESENAETLFDSYYTKAAAFRASVNNKVMALLPDEFLELSVFDTKIQQVKAFISRI
jgi:plasmid replication initiation protein